MLQEMEDTGSPMTQPGSYAVTYPALSWLQKAPPDSAGEEQYQRATPGRHGSSMAIFGDLLLQAPDHLGFSNTYFLKMFSLLGSQMVKREAALGQYEVSEVTPVK